MTNNTYIDQKRIVEFVQKVEDKKKFIRDARLVFSHLTEEVGELSKALWKYHQECIKTNGNGNKYIISKELIDIIFLACYLADIVGADLNSNVENRMEEICKQYGVEK